MDETREEIINNDTEEEQKPEKKRRRRRGAAIVAAFAAGFAACIGVFAALTYGAGLGRVVPKADYDYYEDLSSKFGKYYVMMQMIGEDPLVKEDSDKMLDDAVLNIVS